MKVAVLFHERLVARTALFSSDEAASQLNQIRNLRAGEIQHHLLTRVLLDAEFGLANITLLLKASLVLWMRALGENGLILPLRQTLQMHPLVAYKVSTRTRRSATIGIACRQYSSSLHSLIRITSRLPPRQSHGLMSSWPGWRQ